MSSFAEAASDPGQYDGNVGWSDPINRRPEIQQAMLAIMMPHAGIIRGTQALDIGSGEGWLCDELTRRGASTVGIEPSNKHIQRARERFPGLEFRHTSLAEFQSPDTFSLVTAVMVLEHIRDLIQSLAHIKSLMSTAGKLILVAGIHHEDSTRSRQGYGVDAEQIGDGEIAVRIDKGNRGILYDIIRTPERIMADAIAAGLTPVSHEPVSARKWPEKPSSDVPATEPVLQIFGFAPVK